MMKKMIIKVLSLCICLALSAAFISGCNKNEEKKLPTVGILQYAPHPSLDNCRLGFIEGLKQEGFEEGVNIKFDYQNADGTSQNATMMAENFAAKKYELIAAIATPAATAAYSVAADKNIPVIFSAVTDPVSAKLVNSLENPGKGATGTSDALDLEAQIKMIRAFLPNAKKIGVLYTTSEVNSLTHLNEFKELAPKYNFEIVAVGVSAPADIPLAVDSLLPKVDCINNFTDNNVVNNLQTLIDKANAKKIPIFGSEVEQVKKGCVASESLDYYNLGIETGKLAARVLKGQDVNTLAVKVISEAKPVANQQALDLMGLTVPEDYKDSIEYVTKD